MATLAHTKSHYRGPNAAGYDAHRLRQPKWKAENEAFRELIEGQKGPVLDIPVGTGRFIPTYKVMGVDFIGIDYNEDMLAIAGKKFRGSDLRQGDITNIDLPDKSVETTVCVRILNLMSEKEMQKAIGELCRVTRSTIIFTMRTGEAVVSRPGQRGQTQRRIAMERAFWNTGFHMDRRIELLKSNYHMYRLCAGSTSSAPTE